MKLLLIATVLIASVLNTDGQTPPEVRESLERLRNPTLDKAQRIKATAQLFSHPEAVPELKNELARFAELGSLRDEKDRSTAIQARWELIRITDALGQSTDPRAIELLGPLLLSPDFHIPTGRDNILGSVPKIAAGAMGTYQFLNQAPGPRTYMLADWRAWWQAQSAKVVPAVVAPVVATPASAVGTPRGRTARHARHAQCARCAVPLFANGRLGALGRACGAAGVRSAPRPPPASPMILTEPYGRALHRLSALTAPFDQHAHLECDWLTNAHLVHRALAGWPQTARDARRGADGAACRHSAFLARIRRLHHRLPGGALAWPLCAAWGFPHPTTACVCLSATPCRRCPWTRRR